MRVGAGGDDQVGTASYGTAAVGPEENTGVVMLGLVATTAPDGDPVVIGIRDESRFGPPACSLEILAAGPSLPGAAAPGLRARPERGR